MTPYYDHGGIAIYHGDCREILPSLAPESADLLLTDPPYGVNWKPIGARHVGIAGDGDQVSALTGIAAALRVLKRKRHAYVFGRYEGLRELRISKPVELIWDKERFGPSGDSPWGPAHEYIQFFASVPIPSDRAAGAGVFSARRRQGSVLRFPKVTDNKFSLHPNEKPIQLLRVLIESSSTFGEIVLDPFAGSGSTLVAAQREGRRAIGIEIEERYCEIAARRLQQEVLPLEATA